MNIWHNKVFNTSTNKLDDLWSRVTILVPLFANKAVQHTMSKNFEMECKNVPSGHGEIEKLAAGQKAHI